MDTKIIRDLHCATIPFNQFLANCKGEMCPYNEKTWGSHLHHMIKLSSTNTG